MRCGVSVSIGVKRLLSITCMSRVNKGVRGEGEREGGGERESESERERETERDRETETETETQTDRQTDR